MLKLCIHELKIADCIYEHVSCSISHHYNWPIHTCLMLISTLLRGHDSILSFFSPQSWNICFGFSQLRPCQILSIIMRTPSGNLLFVGIHGDFLFRKQCGDSSQYKKWVTVRERPPWQVQCWILERQHKNTQQTCQVSLIWGTTKLMLPSWMSVVS